MSIMTMQFLLKVYHELWQNLTNKKTLSIDIIRFFYD